MRSLTIALSLACVMLTIQAARADRRVAFVVGNGSYTSVTQLPNPPVDAKAMAATLRNVGFDVVEGTDLTRDKMTQKLLDFGRKAQGADIAVFYYAGHGIAISGTNYLLPVDADIKSEMDVKLGSAINIDVTLDQTMGDAKVKLVFLDACRDNPFAAKIKSSSPTRSVSVQTGLAEMKSGEGTLIAFATGPGQTALDGETGANSPFTRALIANIARPGVEIQQAMTSVRAQVNEETNKGQLPWGHTNLTGAVYLNPAAAPSNAVGAAGGIVPAVAASTAGTGEAELEFWRSVKDSSKPEELNAYLSVYPNGQFKSLAMARIASLDSGASNNATRNVAKGVDPALLSEEGTQVSEDQIGLDKTKRRDVQRRLTGLGFDTRMSGAFDDDTRGVIKRWQAARGYPSTGYLTRLQHKALIAEVLPTAPTASVVGNGVKPVPRAKPAGNAAAGNAPAYRSPPPDSGGNAAGAAFIGGMMGGVIGGALRR
jgi:hypothetical protein